MTRLYVSGPSKTGTYKYKISDAPVDVEAGASVRAWKVWDGVSEIPADDGKYITVVICDSEYKATTSGSALIHSA